jgi:hypothetical protein
MLVVVVELATLIALLQHRKVHLVEQVVVDRVPDSAIPLLTQIPTESLILAVVAVEQAVALGLGLVVQAGLVL